MLISPLQLKPYYSSVFISPHLDDVVLSCGAELARVCQQAPTLVITVFSRSKKKSALRMEEERKVSEALGYEALLLDLPDLEARESLSFFPHRMHRLLKSKDELQLNALLQQLQTILSPLRFERVYAPLGVGFHVDHLLCFEAMRRLYPESFFYEDLPYALGGPLLEWRLKSILGHSPAIQGREELDGGTEGLEKLFQFLFSRPGYCRLPNGVKKILKIYLRRSWYKKLSEIPASIFSTLPLADTLSRCGPFFELKIQAASFYKSQIPSFFHSMEEFKALCLHFHGPEDPYERFWRGLP